MRDAQVIPIGERAASERCRAVTATGRQCRNHAEGDSGYCRVHLARLPPVEGPDGGARHGLRTAGRREGPSTWDRSVKRRRRGEGALVELDSDRELWRQVFMPLLKPLCERYFRVRTIGVDNVPASGSAVLVANHSGIVPLDAVILRYAVAAEHPAARTVRSVADDVALGVPVIDPLTRKACNAVVTEEAAADLLGRGELVSVWPEGRRGVAKGWSKRYRLERFGRTGLMDVALRMRTPIVPVAIVGAEEAYPMIANAGLLAKALRLPYWPVTPTFPLLGPLGLLPLPSKWVIEFGEPISLEAHPEGAEEETMQAFDLAGVVRDTIQQMLGRNLTRRGRAFL